MVHEGGTFFKEKKSYFGWDSNLQCFLHYRAMRLGTKTLIRFAKKHVCMYRYICNSFIFTCICMYMYIQRICLEHRMLQSLRQLIFLWKWLSWDELHLYIALRVSWFEYFIYTVLICVCWGECLVSWMGVRSVPTISSATTCSLYCVS